MRVLFDHQAFEYQRWGGVSRVHLELLRGLPPRGVEVELALVRSRSDYVPQLEALLGLRIGDEGHYETFLGGRKVPLRRQLWSIRRRVAPGTLAQGVNRAHAEARLRAGAFDLFHPTYYDPYFLEPLGGRPFVLTVHDLIHDLYPAMFSRRDQTAARRRTIAARAARIIAVSENTKRDVVARLRIDPAKVDVVPHGFAWACPPAPPPPLPERYVLFTGSRGGYKNWGFFLEALAPLLLDTRGLHVVCTGHPFSADERAHLARLRLAERVLHVPTTEGGLQSIYARAAVFAFPSLYEGFGLPVLEAFAEGCPAALARTSSLPEVGGDAAAYFDPNDADAIRDVVGRLLGDARLRADLVARGRERVRSFTWEAACARTADAYRRALGERVAERAGA